MNKFGIVGIDKIKLVAFDIDIVDLSELYNQPKANIIDTDKYKRHFIIDNEVIELGNIFISDPYFKLTIGVRVKKHSGSIPYQVLEINPARILFGDNIDNVYRSEDLLEAILIVEQRILQYGIKVNLRKAIIEEIEINNNIRLDEEFNNYKNVFEFIKSVLPKTLLKGASYDDRKIADYTGFKVANTQLSLKFYNKFIERSIESEFSLLRIEYRLLNRDKVKGILGINTIEELLCNYSNVKEGFNKLIEKQIVSKSSIRIKELYRTNLNNLLKVQSQQRYYIKYLLSISQDEIIFDYEILWKIIGQLNINKGNKSKRRKELKELLILREHEGNNLFFHNIDRLNEIIIKLGFEDITI